LIDFKKKQINNLPKKNSKRTILRHTLFFATISVALAVAALLVTSKDAASDKDPKVIIKADVPKPHILSLKVKKNDTFYSLLASLGVSPPDIIDIAKKAKKYYNLKYITKGNTLKVTMLNNVLKKIEYRHSDFQSLVVERQVSNGDFVARAVDIPYSVVPVYASGNIANTLYESAVEAGVDSQVIISLSDIFAWDIDFATDIRVGDAFKVYYETVVVEDRTISTGKILGSELMNNGKKYTAIYYEDADGQEGYFNPEGRSVSRQLLKSPLRYRRVSSYFSRKRYHPILKRYRPHHGVDYAAPKGTPVESSGSGRVLRAGWKSGYGNTVTIRHNSTYTTTYGHLSRIGHGIKKGSKIKQGQVIGYVGSTGLSTGPHLHYEVKVNGRLVNPLSIKPRPSRSLKKDEFERFKPVRDTFLARISDIENIQAANSEEPKAAIN